MFKIEKIFRYPVKSMGGDDMQTTFLSENGIPGDRCWTLKDEVRGGIKGGKRFPQLMGMHARLETEPTRERLSPDVVIKIKDGIEVKSNDPEVNSVLSAHIDSPVSLWPLLPKEMLDHYKRGALPEGLSPMRHLRELFARTEDESLPDLSVFPKELATYESPPGTYFDAYPLLIMTRASLRTFSALDDERKFDVRRFRPNILLETEEKGFPEEKLVGQRGRLGSAILKFEIICPRCVMTTHGFDELPKDPKIMRSLVKHNNGNLGVYASVETPGNISLGDQLSIMS